MEDIIRKTRAEKLSVEQKEQVVHHRINLASHITIDTTCDIVPVYILYRGRNNATELVLRNVYLTSVMSYA